MKKIFAIMILALAVQPALAAAVHCDKLTDRDVTNLLAAAEIVNYYSPAVGKSDELRDLAKRIQDSLDRQTKIRESIERMKADREKRERVLRLAQKKGRKQ